MTVMRIVFCGSGDFGLPTLRALVAGPHEIAGVITQPARRAGRGGRPRPTPVAAAAEELHLPARPVEDVNAPAVVADLAALGADLMLVADFGQMIRKPARRACRLRAYNLHGSVLPALRGAAPVNWAIIRGLSETGVTVFRLIGRMDAGAIFARRATAIDPSETAEELRARLADLGVEAVDETLAGLAAGRTDGEPQDDSAATFAPLLSKADGVIDFAADAVTIRNLVHGTWPWPGARARYVAPSGKACDAILARAAAHPGDAGGPPGTIAADGTIATGGGRLEVLAIKPAGKRLMAWRDFVNGYRAGPGARFDSVAR